MQLLSLKPTEAKPLSVRSQARGGHLAHLIRFPQAGSAINVGALIIWIGFWGVLNHDYNKEPPK